MSGDPEKDRRLGRQERRRSFPVRLAFWGFALSAFSAVVSVAAGNATGVFAALPLIFLAVAAAVVLGVTGRGVIAALVVGFLLLLGSLALGLENLGHPQSFADFVPTVLRVVGFAVAVVGAAMALAQPRRPPVRPTSAQRRVLIGGGSLLVLVALVSAILTATQRTTVATANGAVVVTLKVDEFVPHEIPARPATDTVVLVRNVDSYAHTFTVDELNIDQYVGPGSARLIRFTLPATATKRLQLYCAVTGHEGMTAKIIPKP